MMNDDISRLLQGNLPADAPDPAGFGPAARRIRRRRQTVVGVAVLALVAVPVGWGVTQLGSQPQVYATPSVTPTTQEPAPTESVTSRPSPTATTPPDSTAPVTPTVPTTTAPPLTTTQAPQPPQKLTNFGKASFTHFTVELKPIASEGTGQYPNFQVEVCVVAPADPDPDGTTRVSTNPWQLVTSKGLTLDASPSTEFTPAYPAVSRLQVGECASGWIEFRGAGDGFSERLVYSNSVGERAEWTFS